MFWGGRRGMELVTSTVFVPGAEPGEAYPDQVLFNPHLGLMVVADCPGSVSGGRGATQMAIAAVQSHLAQHSDILDRFRRTPDDALRSRIVTLLEDGFARAAQEVFAFARRRSGVAVTLDVVLMIGDEVFVGHVGDGRVFLVRDGLVHQLTIDHVRQAGEVRLQPTESFEGMLFGGRMLSRFLGNEPRVRVESMCMRTVEHDRVFVCAGGVHRGVTTARLHEVLVRSSVDDLAARLEADLSGRAVLAAVAQRGGGRASLTSDDRHHLAQIAPIALFRHLTAEELLEVAQATLPRRAAAGEVIFVQGEPGRELLLLISGTVDIVRDGRHLTTLEAPSMFGEMALLDMPTRSATARASSSSDLLVVPREVFFALLRGHPGLAIKVLWNMNNRLSHNLRETSARLADLERRMREAAASTGQSSPGGR